MYTGIVEDVGEIVKTDDAGIVRRIWVRSSKLANRDQGSSVSVDGVCLTVVERDADVCAFDVSAETRDRTTLTSKSTGQFVNIELPMRADGELGGHIVQGHVDGVGRVSSVEDEGTGRRLRVEIGGGSTRYLVEKGSVTVDGVGLTVTAVDDAGFEVALVPHTLSVTTLGEAEVGREVNVELDVLAKYVERLTSPWRSQPATED